jgi:hypothetical protein
MGHVFRALLFDHIVGWSNPCRTDDSSNTGGDISTIGGGRRRRQRSAGAGVMDVALGPFQARMDAALLRCADH